MSFRYLNGVYKYDQLLTRGNSDRTRGDGFNLKETRLGLDVQGSFFTEREPRCWNSLPTDAVDAPSLEAFKARLNGALGNLV